MVLFSKLSIGGNSWQCLGWSQAAHIERPARGPCPSSSELIMISLVTIWESVVSEIESRDQPPDARSADWWRSLKTPSGPGGVHETPSTRAAHPWCGEVTGLRPERSPAATNWREGFQSDARSACSRTLLSCRQEQPGCRPTPSGCSAVVHENAKIDGGASVGQGGRPLTTDFDWRRPATSGASATTRRPGLPDEVISTGLRAADRRPQPGRIHRKSFTLPSTRPRSRCAAAHPRGHIPWPGRSKGGTFRTRGAARPLLGRGDAQEGCDVMSTRIGERSITPGVLTTSGLPKVREL